MIGHLYPGSQQALNRRISSGKMAPDLDGVMTSKPLELVIGRKQTMRFVSPEEFEFSLAGRTSVPSQKISALMKHTPHELKAEAATIDELEQRLQTMLVRLEDASINRAMMGLDPAVFSHDHDWRSIITGLNECGEEYREFKIIALKMYMQYLHSRKVLLKDIYAERRAMAMQGNEVKDTPVAGGDNLGSTSSPDSALSGTVSDVSLPARNERNLEPVLRRLPKGEPVVVHILAGENIEIRLSKHKFRLMGNGGLALVDPKGQHYPLARGRNMIGRDTECDISLNPSLKDISRRHLIIENPGDNQLKLTDLSTYGTFVVQ